MAGSNPPDLAQAWQQSWEEWARAWAGLTQPVPEGEKPPPTPSEVWKRSMDRWLNAWSSYLEETMTQPEFAASAGQMLNRTLDVQKPLREGTEAAMQRWLEAVNMPSREDIIRLARGLNDVNARLDEIGDRIEQIQDALAALAPGRDGAAAASDEDARLGAGRWS